MFEISDVFYVIGTKGISTLNNEVYKFPSNKEYDWCETYRVGNNILVVCKENYYADVESRLFNQITNQWTDVDIRTKRRTNFAVVYYLNKIFIVGGWDGRQALNSIKVYDPVSKTEVSLIKMNEARYDHKVIAYKKKLFVFSGIGEDGKPLNSVEMFSLETKKFVMMAPMKTARRMFGCCRVGNLVYVVGGYSGDVATNSVEIYDMDSNTWTDGVDLPVAAYNLHACVVNNKF